MRRSHQINLSAFSVNQFEKITGRLKLRGRNNIATTSRIWILKVRSLLNRRVLKTVKSLNKKLWKLTRIDISQHEPSNMHHTWSCWWLNLWETLQKHIMGQNTYHLVRDINYQIFSGLLYSPWTKQANKQLWKIVAWRLLGACWV